MTLSASDVSMTAHTPPRLDDQLCFALYRAGQAVTRTYKQLLAPLGLTYPQYLVMLVMWEHGEQSVKDIGARLGLDSGTLTPLLKRMEAGGFIVRRRDPEDERIVRIAPTAAGTGLQDLACRVMDGLLGQADMPMAEVIALRDTLNDLKTRLDTKNT